MLVKNVKRMTHETENKISAPRNFTTFRNAFYISVTNFALWKLYKRYKFCVMEIVLLALNSNAPLPFSSRREEQEKLRNRAGGAACLTVKSL